MSSVKTGPLRTTQMDTQFGVNVARQRIALGISQDSLCVLLSRRSGWEWARKTLGKIELGTRPVRLSEAYALAEVLDCTVDELSGRTATQTSMTPQTVAQLAEVRRTMTLMRNRERQLLADVAQRSLTNNTQRKTK